MGQVESHKLTIDRSALDTQTSETGGALSAWARLIKRVYEVDPLECPCCGGQMKIVSFIERCQGDVIEQILRHCSLWEGPLRTSVGARGPPQQPARASPPWTSSSFRIPRSSSPIVSNPTVASSQRKRRVSCSWFSIPNSFRACLLRKLFSHRDSRSSLRYAPLDYSKHRNPLRMNDLGTVFVLVGPKIVKLAPDRPDKSAYRQSGCKQPPNVTAQVELADSFRYS